MDGKQIEELLLKYSKGECTIEEQALLEDWYIRFREDKEVDLSEQSIQRYLTEMRNKLPLLPLEVPKGTLRLWPRIVAAASIFVCIGIGFYFYQNDHTTSTEITAKNDIAPGGNKAFLTLADGKRISLTNAKTGELAEQSGVKIMKAADGQLIYTVSNPSNGNNRTNNYNTIETPRGGTYQVRLPDGTKVWLNAASTLRFPSSFARLVNRRVELLSGEAYFEVAKDKKHPFIVQTDQQEVEVLGTHFNVNSYADELSTKTTLLEGSVRISQLEKNGAKGKSEILKPNKQAILLDHTLKVIDADIDSDIAWKNQKFVFKGEDIKSIMRKLSRWYDIEVSYNGDCSNLSFYGIVSQTRNISSVLKLMENTGNVHFKIEGRKITVSR